MVGIKLHDKVEAVFECMSAACVMSSKGRSYSCLTLMGVFGYVCECVRAHVTWVWTWKLIVNY